MKRKPAPPTAPAVPAAVPAPLAASPPVAHQPSRAAAGPALPSLEDKLYGARLKADHAVTLLVAADARAEHWAAQADRLARQVERMREAVEAAADEISPWGDQGYSRSATELRMEELAGRLRAAAKGED